MRTRIAGLLTISAFIGAGCGNNGSSGTPAPPTAPSVPAAQPATVNVGGGAQGALAWAGQAG